MAHSPLQLAISFAAGAVLLLDAEAAPSGGVTMFARGDPLPLLANWKVLSCFLYTTAVGFSFLHQGKEREI